MELKLLSIKLPAWALPAAIATATVFLYVFGVLGLMKAAPFGDDFHVFYRAGEFFLHGANPWESLRDSGTPFSYPPHSLSIVGAYSLLPYHIALALHTLINFASIAAIAWLANRWFIGVQAWDQLNLAQLLPLFLLVANFYTATSIHQGQLTLVATAALFFSWYFLHRERWILAGLFLGLATVKPQVSVLYVVWLLLDRRVSALSVGAACAGILLIPSLLSFGIIGSFHSWLSSVAHYTSIPINAPGAPYVVGVESLLVAHGISLWPGFYKILTLLFVGILYWQRARFDTSQIVYALLVITFTFLYGHDYDYTAVVGIFSYLLYLCLKKPSAGRLAMTLLIVLLFFVPQRIFRSLDWTLLHHLRTLLLPLTCYLLFHWSKSAYSDTRNSTCKKQAP